MENILVEEPLSQNDINGQVLLYKMAFAFKTIMVFAALGAIAAVFSYPMLNILDGVAGASNRPSTNTLLAFLGISVGLLTASILAAWLVNTQVRFSKLELKPVAPDEKETMLGFCEKHLEIDTYRRKLIAQGRQSTVLS